MISVVLFALAAICNALCDNIQFHWESSVFNSIHLNPQWWNPAESWRNKYILRNVELGRKKWFWGINYPDQLTDAWHFFKMWMIIFLAGATTAMEYDPISILENQLLNIILLIAIFGTTWNTTFSLFFNKIFKK